MLFSATQTKRVKDLVRLSLHDPTYIAIHAQSASPTPVKLQQVQILPFLILPVHCFRRTIIACITVLVGGARADDAMWKD